MILCLFLFHTFGDAATEDQKALFKLLETEQGNTELLQLWSPVLDPEGIGYTEWLVKTADMEQ